MTSKLIFPAGVQSFEDSQGNTYAPDVNNQCQPASGIDIDQFINAGFTVPTDTASATRPTTGLYAGMHYFDSTLYSGVGGPIWRNAANTGWINATGTTV